MDDKIDNTFKSTKIDLFDGMDFTYEIQRRVREDEDNFIFETIEPYCSNIAQVKISKKDLDEAIQLWKAAKRIMHVGDKNEYAANWIKIKCPDDLPALDVDVLGTLKEYSDVVKVARQKSYIEDCGWEWVLADDIEGNSYEPDEIIAWMPLPERFKEDKNE